MANRDQAAVHRIGHRVPRPAPGRCDRRQGPSRTACCNARVMTYDQNIDVYEHGIVVSDGERPPSGLSLIATTRQPIYNSYSLTLVDRDGTSLNHRAVHALDVPGAHAVVDYHEESDARFFLRESLYHLNNVIDKYIWACQLFEELHGHYEGPRSGNTGDSRVLFEIDAYLGAARRVYEAISKVLWKHYHPGEKGRWDSIRTATRAIASGNSKVPAQLGGQIVDSWNAYGAKLADYRNFVAHTGALSEGETCWLHRYDRRWGASVMLLENPENKKRVPLRPDVGIDALAYCYEVAIHLVKLCEQVAATDAVADYLANPPGYGGLPASPRWEAARNAYR